MDKLVFLDELVAIRRRLWDDGQKVVFTNGCFDLLHQGHIQCIKAARTLGDVLILGLNSDASIVRLKGEDRPVLSQDARVARLSELEEVDYICVFEEDTPLSLLRALLPDVLVKGGDYAPHEIVGREIVEGAGGRVATVPFLAGYSTTRLICAQGRSEE